MNEQQYERIARFLDGEPVELTPEETQAAEEIRTLESSMTGLVELTPPGETMKAAHRRLIRELGRPRKRMWRVAISTAAAAAIVVAAVSLYQRPQPYAGPELGMEDVVAIYTADGNYDNYDNYDNGGDEADYDLIEKELQSIEADIVATASPETDEEWIETDDEDLEAFWLNEFASGFDEG